MSQKPVSLINLGRPRGRIVTSKTSRIDDAFGPIGVAKRQAATDADATPQGGHFDVS